MISQRRPIGLAIELSFLFFLLPVLLRIFLPGRFLLPLLWVAASVCLAWLWRNPHFERSELWSFTGQGRNLLRVLARFAIAVLIIGVAVALLAPDLLFNLVRARPVLWLMIVLLYPVLSAYPQGIIYRGFFFRRYRHLFRTPSAMLVASAASFAAAHVVFGNVLAVALTLIGGLVFAQTYLRTKSLAVAWLEHALYGCFLFTIGLGSFFYTSR